MMIAAALRRIAMQDAGGRRLRPMRACTRRWRSCSSSWARAVAFVRLRYPRRLISDIALTLGIFLLVIGTIVYTVAFRGLRPLEVVVAWVLSFGAIAWFVVRLNAIMSRPLTSARAARDRRAAR